MNPEDSSALARLIRGERVAHLATLRGGAPMASMTLYLADASFAAFYLHVSRLAWHTQDLLQDGRCALSIAQSDDRRPDPFTLMRVSIRGDASRLAGAQEELRKAWLERFPEQAVNFTLADFSFWQMTPREARFVAGFGRIYNLSAADLSRAAA